LALCARQFGLITRRQWLDSGLSERQLDHAIRTAAVSVVHPGVYRLRGSHPCFEQDVLAACLATGGVASLAPLVAERRAGRPPTESELEDDLLALIRRYRLPEPVPQYPCRGRRIDFAYPELVFGIEANSVSAHAAKEDVQRNASKANDLVEWWILYFTHDDVHLTPAETARTIEDAIARRRSAPPAQPAA